jgi:hypothetical protein
MGANDAPVNIIAHAFHLFLAYPGGSLQHSKIGDPTVWDGALGAGEFGCGSNITNLITGVQSSLVIILEDGIRILAGTTIDDFDLQTFSINSGGKLNSAQNLLGTIFFLDDRGLTSMEAVQEFGDYGANSISQRFKRSLTRDDRSFTCSTVSRDLNQYRIFFNDSAGIFVSFEAKEFKGATTILYDRPVNVVASGELLSGKEIIVFADATTGYVYRMDSGTSLDGQKLLCKFSTAFNHYGTPRQRKGLRKATFEIKGEPQQVFNVRADFDYNEPGPRPRWYTARITTPLGTSVYGRSKWGDMRYGATSVATNRVPVYIVGQGVNISYKVSSSETYRQQHIIQNIITDYSIEGRQV